MLPTTVDTSEEVNDFEIVETADQPTKTYCMDLERPKIHNYADGQGAMKQAIFKILQTERYDHSEIYSNNYGVELKELIGMPLPFVIPEAERRIKEAVLWDERMTDVKNFKFSMDKKTLSVNFIVDTIFGTVEITGFSINY